MVRQIKYLTQLLLCNFWGINELRYGKDKSKKGRFILTASGIGLLVVMYMAYIGAMAYAYINMGLQDIMPGCMLTLVSMLILFFTIYKAGNIIFQMKSYDMLISMPVSTSAIIVSRFLTMYVNNLFLCFVTFLPITIVYAFSLTPGVSFYVMLILTVFLAPLFPMILATAVSVLVLAVSARTKHKTIVNIVLSMILVVVLVIAPMFCNDMSDVELEEMMMNMSVVVADQINRIYPIAAVFTNALIRKSFGWFFVFAGISLGSFMLFVWLVQWKFVKICSWLKVNEARRSYSIHGIRQNSMMKALLEREVRHYFSSSVYVLNTMIGYVMMVIVAASLLIFGTEQVDKLLGIPGLFSKLGVFIIAIAGTITSTTSSSISLEGKNYWNLQILPVSGKNILDSKILLNLVIALPFYLVTEICMILSCHDDLIQCIWYILIPIVYIVFSSVVGITMNLKFPVMNWENETAVVKQSMAVFATMMVNFIACILPAALLLFASGINENIVQAITVVIVIFATVILYVRNCKGVRL